MNNLKNKMIDECFWVNEEGKKKWWREFFTKNFNISEITKKDNIVIAKIGIITYNAWIVDDKICVQQEIQGDCFITFYFKVDTLEYDWEYTRNRRKKAIEEEVEVRMER